MLNSAICLHFYFKSSHNFSALGKYKLNVFTMTDTATADIQYSYNELVTILENIDNLLEKVEDDLLVPDQVYENVISIDDALKHTHEALSVLGKIPDIGTIAKLFNDGVEGVEKAIEAGVPDCKKLKDIFNPYAEKIDDLKTKVEDAKDKLESIGDDFEQLLEDAKSDELLLMGLEEIFCPNQIQKSSAILTNIQNLNASVGADLYSVKSFLKSTAMKVVEDVLNPIGNFCSKVQKAYDDIINDLNSHWYTRWMVSAINALSSLLSGPINTIMNDFGITSLIYKVISELDPMTPLFTDVSNSLGNANSSSSTIEELVSDPEWDDLNKMIKKYLANYIKEAAKEKVEDEAKDTLLNAIKNASEAKGVMVNFAALSIPAMVVSLGTMMARPQVHIIHIMV